MTLVWDDARAFLAVARRRTLTAAASDLMCGVATTSRKIERLERSLGVKLFTRHQTGFRITDDGEALLPKAEALEAAAQAFVNETGDRVSGRVRVATAENLANSLFIPALADLLDSHPDLTVEIVTDVAAVNLHRRDADLAIRMVRPDSGNVRVRKIGALGYGLYGAKEYVARRPGGITGMDLTQDRFIAWSESQGGLRQAIWLDRVLNGRAPCLMTTTLAGQVRAVKEGLGLAVVPHFLALEAGLVELETRPDVRQDIWLVVHADLAQSLRVRVVAEHLVAVIEKNAELLSNGAN